MAQKNEDDSNAVETEAPDAPEADPVVAGNPEVPEAPEAPTLPPGQGSPEVPVAPGQPPVAPGIPETPANPETPPLGGMPPASPANPEAKPYFGGQSEKQFIDTITHPQDGEMDDQALKWYQDIANRHIEPKTYGSLFAKQDTAGKVGLAFSILMSSIGAGLTHQSNAALDIMDKAIGRDLEAQKESKENANNYLKTLYDHNLQEAHQRLVTAQASQIPISNKEIEAKTQDIKADAALKTQTQAFNYMKIGYMNDLQDSVNSMPPQQRQLGQQVLDNVVKPKFIGDIQKANAETTQLLRARAQVRGANDQSKQPTQDFSETGVDLNKMHHLIKLGEVGANIGVPTKGIHGDDARSVKDQAEMVMDNRAVAKMFADSYQKLNNITGSREYPGLRAAEINALQTEVARQTAGRFSAPEAAAQAEGMFPEPGDSAKTRSEKFNKTMQFFQSKEAPAEALKRYDLLAPFPKYSPHADPNEGKIIQDKAGNQQIWHNGKWAPYNSKKGK